MYLANPNSHDKAGTQDCGITAKVLDSDVKVNEFELQSCYYVYLWSNTLKKGMNLIITTHSYGLNSITAVLIRERRLWH